MGLVFKKDNLEKILQRRKTQTRRTSRNELRVGKVYPIRCRYFEKAKVKVLITRKFKQRLGDISLKDVRKEGFDSLEEFQAYWTRIHGSWNPNLIVTVYEFKLVMPEREPLEFSRRAHQFNAGFVGSGISCRLLGHSMLCGCRLTGFCLLPFRVVCRCCLMSLRCS